jgi:hypothetical protein
MENPTYSQGLMFVVRALLLLILTSFLGCATTGSTTGSSAVLGLVQDVGPEGAPSLDEQGRIRTLVGPRQLLDQLARLPGAIVSIRGPATSSSVRVREFEIVDAGDGLRPLVGHVIVDQAGVQLEDQVTGTRLALRGEALAFIKHQHGSRVWVTGSVIGPQTFLIAHWGLLVPADDTP